QGHVHAMPVFGAGVNALRLGPHGPADAEDRITTDVEQAAAGEFWLEADVVRIERLHVESKRTHDAPHLTDATAVEELPQFPRTGMVRPHEAVQEADAPGLADLDDALGLGGGGGQWLFAKDVLAALRRLDRPFAVQRVRQWDVDGVNRWIVEQGLVAAVGDGNPG